MDSEHDDDEQCILHLIIKQNFEKGYECIEKIEHILTQNEVNMNIHDLNGETPLHCAASRGITEIIRKLLSYKGEIYVDSINYACETPLHLAVEHGFTESVKLLLEFGADPNARRAEDGSSPLHIATQNEYLDILVYLLQNGAKNLPNFHNNTPLHLAALNGNAKIINYYLNNCVSNIHTRNNWNKTALQLVIENMYPEYKEFFNDVVTEYNLKNILKNATKRNHIDLIKLLLKFNSMETHSFLSGNDLGHSMYNSAGDNFVEIIEVLLSYGTDINHKIRGNTALCSAAHRGKKEAVKFLIQKGAEVNLEGRHSKTPLHYATRNSDFEIVKMLLEAGADPNLEDIKKETALHEGALFLNISQLLLEYEADIYIANEYGETPFIVAGEMRRLDVLYLFRWHMLMREVLDTHLEKDEKDIIGPEVYEQYGGEGEMLYPRTRCVKETEKFDRMILDDISFRDILVENFRKLDQYLEDDRLSSYIFSETIIDDFPIYAKMIRSKFRKCMQLAALLKPIGNTTVSLYDVLVKSHSQLVSLLGNEEVVEVIESLNLREITPRYALQIGRNFARALKKKKLLDEIMHGIEVNTNDFQRLPIFLVERILDFLDEDNLELFKRTLWFEPLDKSSEESSEEETREKSLDDSRVESVEEVEEREVEESNS